VEMLPQTKMGKKKGRRQVDPSRDQCESTEDEAEDSENLNSCPHTGNRPPVREEDARSRVLFLCNQRSAH
jgi:hypothetical protein